MVEIKGIEKFSSRDFPGHISSTVFFGGCTFRCPYCHNSQLVLEPEKIQSMSPDYFLSYLDGRKGWLEAVCLTGGEPLLHEDIEDVIRVVRERGLLVKLDTNGSFPDRLEALLALGLLDRVAMDVKAPLLRYREVTRSNIDLEKIVRSVDLLRSSSVEHWFRTTVVPGFVPPEDLSRGDLAELHEQGVPGGHELLRRVVVISLGVFPVRADDAAVAAGPDASR